MIRNIPSLDGLRAVSIFLVITGHILLTTPLSDALAFLPANFNLSGLGVNIFFVISGFLITYLLLAERQKTGQINFLAFYQRRALRIFPAFYTYLFAISIVNLTVNLNLSWPIILGAGLFVQNFVPWGPNWFVEHTWSLSVEEQFYILWPFLFVRFPKLKGIKSYAGVMILCALIRSLNYKFPDVAIYFLSPFLMNADFLFTGCFIAYQYFYRAEEVRALILKAKPIFVLIAIGVLWVTSRFEYHPIYDRIFIPLSGIAGCLCIGFLLLYFIEKDDTAGYRFLNLPIVKFVGRLSYSIYLWQQLFLSNLGLWITTFPQNILATVLAALCSYFLIEKPFLRIKERFRAVPINTFPDRSETPLP
ncbi:MAG: acyltransferase [Chryseolinea sp.]